MSTTLHTTALTGMASGMAAALTTIPGLKVYGYETRAIDSLPAVMVGTMDVDRTPPDGIESELGSVDWQVTTKTRLYVQCDDPETAYLETRRLIPLVVAALETDGVAASCGALDMTVVKTETGFTDDSAARQMAVTTFDVEAFLLVQDY